MSRTASQPTAANQDPDSDTNLVNVRLRLPGQYLDEETGLHYNYFRDYVPSLGRYTQSDPIGLDGGLNTYGYVGGNPLRFVDVYGLCFLGKSLAQDYIDKYGEYAWDYIRTDRDSTLPVIPGTDSEALRNAEHYLYARKQVLNNSYEWGPMLVSTVAYNAAKFWTNVGEYYGVVASPWTNSINTTDELKSGIEGANDALFGRDDHCECSQ